MRPTHRDLYSSFVSHDVRYLLIGGAAVIVHGVDRGTLDVDILIEATPDNARRAVQALRDAGLGTAFLLEPDELLGKQIVILDDWLPVDVQTATPGIDFAQAWERREVMTVDGVPVNVLSLEDLIASKEAAGRPEDLEDVAALRRIQRGDP